MKIFSNFCIFAFLAIANLCQAQTTANVQTQQTTVPSPTPYTIISRDANSRVWEQTTYEVSPSGQVVAKLHHYTELATGLNYQENGQWVNSQEQINIQPDGSASATAGQHQVYFPSDIYNGTIIMKTPDGLQLQSQPLGLFYDDGSNTIMIAELTNSVGQLISPNQIIYTNAFTGLDADLLYTYTKAGFEQDVILNEQPQSPGFYGLNPQTAQLQMLTEFFNPPQPAVTTVTLPEQAGLALADDTLDFGTMKMVPGRAFLLGANANDAQVSVGKQWVSVGGRQFLIEAIPVGAVANQLSDLPATQTSSINQKYPLNVVSAKRLLPVHRLAGKIITHPMRISQTKIPTRGLLLDYQTINSSQTNLTFLGDTTYCISGTVDLFGTNTFEGGTVIKYTTNGSIAQVGGQIDWNTHAYNPVILTAKDDNSAGQTISGSTGSPIGYYANPALELVSLSGTAPTISCFRIAYAQQAILLAGPSPPKFYNGQIINCQGGFTVNGANECYLRNILFCNVQTNLNNLYDGSFDVQNSTFSTSSNLMTIKNTPYQGVELYFTNCVFVNISNLTNAYTASPITFQMLGNDNGFYNATAFGLAMVTNQTYPFQTVNGGDYYLTTNCWFRGAGTNNIDPILLSNLQVRTTSAPLLYNAANFTVPTNFGPYAIRDTNTLPDLGYHYDPLDYIFINSCQAYTNLTFTTGTAAAWSTSEGIQLEDQLTVTFSGTATSPDYWVRCNTVQEEDSNGSYGAGGIASEYSQEQADAPMAQATFTRFSMLAGYGNPFRDDNGQLNLSLNDCEFWDTGEGGYGIALNATNCLFDETYIGVQAECCCCADLYMQNCTMHGSSMLTSHWGSWPTSIQNCAFDGTDLSQVDSDSYADYNAYLTNADQLPSSGSHDVIVTNYNWESSWFGNFYLPTNSPLIQAGSTNANYLGLYHFTTQTNQVPEGTNIVDIGYHYVATDQYGNPLDTNGDGIPDYLEDANGDGLFDGDDLADWQISPYGLNGANAFEVFTPLKP